MPQVKTTGIEEEEDEEEEEEEEEDDDDDDDDDTVLYGHGTPSSSHRLSHLLSSKRCVVEESGEDNICSSWRDNNPENLNFLPMNQYA
jgi:hypothetical protein